MKYKNIEEMINQKETVEEGIKGYVKDIAEYKQLRKEMMRTVDKKYYSNVIKDCKNELTRLKKYYQNLNNEINKTFAIPEDILMPFVVECINLYESEEYVYHKIMLSNGLNLIDGYMPNYGFYNLIFPKHLESDINRLENTFLVSKMPQVYRDFLNENTCKYIMNCSNYEMNLVNCNGINSLFEDFPYLESVGYNLANRRISETDDYLIDILDDELAYQKEEVKVKKLH